MSTKLLKSKPFQRILAGKFALPKEQSCGWFFEDADDRGDAFRGAVRALCALGAAAVALLSEAVEHQEITRKNVSKLVESLEGQGLIIVHDGVHFLNCPRVFVQHCWVKTFFWPWTICSMRWNRQHRWSLLFTKQRHCRHPSERATIARCPLRGTLF